MAGDGRGSDRDMTPLCFGRDAVDTLMIVDPDGNHIAPRHTTLNSRVELTRLLDSSAPLAGSDRQEAVCPYVAVKVPPLTT
jgi:hypothetical protein